MSEPPISCNLLGLQRYSTPKSHALSNSPDLGLQELHAPLHCSPYSKVAPFNPSPNTYLSTPARKDPLSASPSPGRGAVNPHPHPLAWCNGVLVLGPFPRTVTPVGAHSFFPLPVCIGSRFTILPQAGPKPAPPQVPRCCPSLAPGEARVSLLPPSAAAAATTTEAAATSVAHSAAPARATLSGQA